MGRRELQRAVEMPKRLGGLAQRHQTGAQQREQIRVAGSDVKSLATRYRGAHGIALTQAREGSAEEFGHRIEGHADYHAERSPILANRFRLRCSKD